MWIECDGMARYEVIYAERVSLYNTGLRNEMRVCTETYIQVFTLPT